MHPIRPDARGFSLVEATIAIVLTGILGAAVIYFLYPVRQAMDITVRADLTEAADSAVQRIARDVRLAVPNSVRQRTDGTGTIHYLEFLAIRSAGRYRSDTGSAVAGAACPADEAALAGATDNDLLSFDTAADTCFKTVGKEATMSSVVADDLLILNNYGAGFTGQDAYEAAGANRTTINSVTTTEANRDRVDFDAKTFQRTLHDSPGKRFFISSGPVTYKCDPNAKTLTRHTGYGLSVSQPIAVGAGDLVTNKVTSCAFDYTANVAPQVGLLTLRIQLSEAVSSGVQETVSLYHAVHVSNVP